jgi:hypothetical protein
MRGENIDAEVCDKERNSRNRAINPEQLRAASQNPRNALRRVGPQIQWVQSYVTDDKIYCVYLAPDEAAIRKHPRLAGFPVTASLVSTTIDRPPLSEARFACAYPTFHLKSQHEKQLVCKLSPSECGFSINQTETATGEIRPVSSASPNSHQELNDAGEEFRE